MPRSKTCSKRRFSTSAAAKPTADARAIGVNVPTYAPNREPKGKEQAFDPPDGEAASATGPPRATINIAKPRHGGGCNDAPGALLNLLRTATQGELKLQV